MKSETRMARYQKGSIQDEGDRWKVRYRVDEIDPMSGETRRRRKSELLSKKEYPNKRSVQKWLDTVLREVNDDHYRPAPAEDFSDFAKRWMRDVMVHHKPSTQLAETSDINAHLVPAFGKFQMKNVTAESIQRWVSGQELAPKTVANRVATMRNMWKTAKAWGYVTHNPFEGLRMPTVKTGNVYQFSAEEMMAIIHEAHGWHSSLFELLAKTGMRPGEAFGLRPEDIDGRTVHVRQSLWKGIVQTTKTTSSVRDFTISDQLADKLRSHAATTCPNPYGLIFLNGEGRPVKGSKFVEKVLNPILKKLGIADKIKASGGRGGNYAFRHGHMTELSRSGVTLKTIQARVGHSAGSDVTMKHYIHAISADDVKAADIMEALLNPTTDGSVQ
jgi:integrase